MLLVCSKNSKGDVCNYLFFNNPVASFELVFIAMVAISACKFGNFIVLDTLRKKNTYCLRNTKTGSGMRIDLINEAKTY